MAEDRNTDGAFGPISPIQLAAAVHGGRGSQPRNASWTRDHPSRAAAILRVAEDRNNMDAENLFIHENNWRSSSAATEDRNNACKTLYLGGGADWQAPLAAAENRNEFTQA